jgi:hypothetical protein
MSTRDETIARHVENLRDASGLFYWVGWLAWVEYALGVGLCLLFFSDYIPHWGVYVVAFLAYAVLSACAFIASWVTRVVVYLFEELRLVV